MSGHVNVTSHKAYKAKLIRSATVPALATAIFDLRSTICLSFLVSRRRSLVHLTRQLFHELQLFDAAAAFRTASADLRLLQKPTEVYSC